MAADKDDFSCTTILITTISPIGKLTFCIFSYMIIKELYMLVDTIPTNMTILVLKMETFISA